MNRETSHAKAFVALATSALFIDPSIDIRGPISLGKDDPFFEQLRRFRSAEYSDAANHLLSDFQERLEEQCGLDERSTHFFAIRDDELIGALRATPSPFELSELCEALRPVNDEFPDYVELSRLVVGRKHRGSSAGRKLIAAAARWGVASQTGGIVAICRDEKYALFEKYGLRGSSRTQLAIPSRPNGLYSFLHASWDAIAKTTLEAFGLLPAAREARVA